MSDTADLAELEPFLTGYLSRLGPAERIKINRKIGQELRRTNAKRIAANVQPDGTAMDPRKKRKAGKGAKASRAKMFRKLRLAKQMKVRPTADEVSVGFERIAGRTARVHQFGLVDFVGRTKAGKVVRTKYPKRVLLGFASEDHDRIADIVLASLQE